MSFCEAKQVDFTGAAGAKEILNIGGQIQKFSRDIGVKLLVLDDLFIKSEEIYFETQNHVNILAFYRFVQLAIMQRVVQSGGTVIIHTKELFGIAFEQALQLLCFFFENVAVVKPWFSPIQLADQWVVCTGKRRVDYNKEFNEKAFEIAMNNLQQLLLPASEQERKVDQIPVDMDEQFNHFGQFFKVPEDRSLVAYLRHYNDELFKL